MHPKEMKSGLLPKALYRLFIYFIEEIIKMEKSIQNDENRKYFVCRGAHHLSNAHIIEERIKKMWVHNKDLLSGLLVYLNACDDYFNPKFNKEDLFFRKIFTFNRDILEKIGKKVVKPLFPFQSMDNYKKKFLLIR